MVYQWSEHLLSCTYSEHFGRTECEQLCSRINCRTFQPCRPLSTMNAILVLSVPIVWNPIPNTTPTLFLLSLCLKPSVYLVNSACLYSLSFVTFFSRLQTHTQSRYIIGHLRSYTSHNTIGQCSHTAISLVLYAVDKRPTWPKHPAISWH